VGRVHLLKTTARDWPPPTAEFLKISGGICHDCGSHDLDMSRWIVGEDPCEVYCMASAWRQDVKDLNDWDTVVMLLKYPSGAMCTIDLSRSAVYGYDQRLEVHGEKGMIQAMNLHPSSVIVSTNHGISGDTNLHSFPQRYAEAYKNELNHLIELVHDHSLPVVVQQEDACKAAILADAAHRSAVEGRPVQIKY
jgi:myo-inositol 2-dehydrogenase/D-chiro-inositol 1-dehydrogenase